MVVRACYENDGGNGEGDTLDFDGGGVDGGGGRVGGDCCSNDDYYDSCRNDWRIVLVQTNLAYYFDYLMHAPMQNVWKCLLTTM